MRLGYLGPPGTFSEEALRAQPLAAEAELVPFASIHETVMAVEAGGVDYALVPIENSLEGGIPATLDALAVDASDVLVGAAAKACCAPSRASQTKRVALPGSSSTPAASTRAP